MAVLTWPGHRSVIRWMRARPKAFWGSDPRRAPLAATMLLPRASSTDRSPDDDAALRASMNVRVARSILAATAICASVVFVTPGTNPAVSVAIYVPTFALLLTAYRTAKAGWPRAPGLLLTFTGWASVTASLALSNCAAVMSISYVPVTMLASTTLGVRAGMVTAALCSVTAAAMYLLGAKGSMLLALIPATRVFAWIVLTFALVVVALLHGYALGAAHAAIGRQREALRAREAARALAERRALLGEAVASLSAHALTVDGLRGLLPEVARAVRAHLGGEVFLVLRERDGVARWSVDDDGAVHSRALDGAVVCEGEGECADDLCASLGFEAPARRFEVRGPANARASLVVCGGGACDPADLADTFLKTVAAVLGGVWDRAHVHERALRAQRLELLGQLTGGVVHDIRNVLTAVQGASCELRERHGASPDDIAALDDLDATVARAGGIAKRLLAVARAEPHAACRVDLAAVVRDNAPMLRRVVGAHVRIVADELAEAPVWADPGALEQVLLNLVVNARDAMPDGGAVTLRTRVVDGDRCELSVQDTGRGMSEDTARRAFEPFFTTRADGTGLGLATVAELVARVHGTAHLESAPGAGTTVTVLLPRHAG